MPFGVASVLRTNQAFGALEGFQPNDLLQAMEGAETIVEVAERLGLFAELEEPVAEALKGFFANMPQSLDAAILGSVRSALDRGVRVQLTWKPGYDFELRAWEVSQGSEGLLNLQLITEHPPGA